MDIASQLVTTKKSSEVASHDIGAVASMIVALICFDDLRCRDLGQVKLGKFDCSFFEGLL